jgi:hypothetical protein
MAVVGNFAAPIGKFGIMVGNLGVIIYNFRKKAEKWVHYVRKLLLS